MKTHSTNMKIHIGPGGNIDLISHMIPKSSFWSWDLPNITSIVIVIY